LSMKFLRKTVAAGKGLLSSVLFALPMQCVMAYETPTHMSITRHALLRSELVDPETLFRIGLFPELEFTNVERPADEPYVDIPGSSIRADAMVWLAVHKEDEGMRSLEHFFDPHNDRGLQAHLASDPDVYRNVGL